MPAKNSVKQYVKDGYYHIYNRGVEKRKIFQDQQDYAVFLSYLKQYLLPKNEKALNEKFSAPRTSARERNKIAKLLRMNNFSKEINLLAYCLMPNHFHFLIKQKKAESIDSFMQSLATRYTTYFNKKYRRVGSLYQGVYRAVLVTSDEQFLHLSRYIHQQALVLKLQGETLQEQQPCSYYEYLGRRKSGWVHPEEVLAFFDKTNPKLSYENFVKQTGDIGSIEKIILE